VWHKELMHQHATNNIEFNPTNLVHYTNLPYTLTQLPTYGYTILPLGTDTFPAFKSFLHFYHPYIKAVQLRIEVFHMFADLLLELGFQRVSPLPSPYLLKFCFPRAVADHAEHPEFLHLLRSRRRHKVTYLPLGKLYQKPYPQQ
jgi:hypothetical protein